MDDNLYDSGLLEYLNSLHAAVRDNGLEMDMQSQRSMNPNFETNSLIGLQDKLMNDQNNQFNQNEISRDLTANALKVKQLLEGKPIINNMLDSLLLI